MLRCAGVRRPAGSVQVREGRLRRILRRRRVEVLDDLDRIAVRVLDPGDQEPTQPHVRWLKTARLQILCQVLVRRPRIGRPQDDGGALAGGERFQAMIFAGRSTGGDSDPDEPGDNRRYDYVRVGTETAAREITAMLALPVVGLWEAGYGQRPRERRPADGHP